MRHKVKKRQFEQVWANIGVRFSREETQYVFRNLRKQCGRCSVCIFFPEEAAVDVLIFTVVQSFSRPEVMSKPCMRNQSASL